MASSQPSQDRGEQRWPGSMHRIDVLERFLRIGPRSAFSGWIFVGGERETSFASHEGEIPRFLHTENFPPSRIAPLAACASSDIGNHRGSTLNLSVLFYESSRQCSRCHCWINQVGALPSTTKFLGSRQEKAIYTVVHPPSFTNDNVLWRRMLHQPVVHGLVGMAKSASRG
jgi:hypothetical protein